MKILVVEDDPFSGRLLENFLTKNGFQFTMTRTGAEAWNQFLADPARIIITDCNMPGMNGLELCQRVRDHHTGRYTYILMLTSGTDDIEGLAAGADDFMTKPFDPRVLQFRLQAAQRVLDLEDRLENQLEQVNESRQLMQQAHDRLREELNSAASLQRALLPRALSDQETLKMSWAFEPSEHLGGDAFNVFQLADNRYALAVADVCGHGIKPALLAVTLQHVLNPSYRHTPLLWADFATDPKHRVVPPTEVMSRLNQQFPMDMETGQYFTLLYAILETDTGCLQYSTAGHPPPILIAADQPARQLPGTGCPIGLHPDNEFDLMTTTIGPADRLLLFSDGMFETTNPAGEPIGMERILEWIEEGRALDTAGLVRLLSGNIIDWAGKDRPDDDVSVLVVEYTEQAVPKAVRRTLLPDATMS